MVITGFDNQLATSIELQVNWNDNAGGGGN